MRKTLFLFCGVFNALFAVFHLLLFLVIQRMPGIDPGLRALLHAFNFGGTLMIIFLATVFFLCSQEFSTRLGRLTILLGAFLYLSRGLVEVILFPKIQPAILGLCLLVGALHLLAFRFSAEEQSLRS
jgi:hypothetical protein